MRSKIYKQHDFLKQHCNAVMEWVLPYFALKGANGLIASLDWYLLQSCLVYQFLMHFSTIMDDKAVNCNVGMKTETSKLDPLILVDTSNYTNQLIACYQWELHFVDSSSCHGIHCCISTVIQCIYSIYLHEASGIRRRMNKYPWFLIYYL